MNRRTRWTAALGAGAALAWTLGCGGSGGGSSGSGGTGQITGSLSHSGAVRVAHVTRTPAWLARAAGWIGAGSAFADGTTDCGNPTVPAAGVTVTLLLVNSDGTTTEVATTTTDASGEFTFSGLAPGSYVVQVTLPTGTLSSQATVVDGQTTTLSGELDVDCHDQNANGNTAEVELKVKQTMPDGSQSESDNFEDENGDHSSSNGQTGTQGSGGEDNHGSTSSGSGSSSEDSGSSEHSGSSGSDG